MSIDKTSIENDSENPFGTDKLDWFKNYMEEKNKLEKENKVVLKGICSELYAKGVTTISMTYDGSGDSGEIDSIAASDGDGKNVELADDTSVKLKDLLEVFLPDGWEINEGSYGEMEITLPEGKLHIDHSERIVETNSSEIDFDLEL